MASHGCQQILRLGSHVVLSYWLWPEAFGVIMIVNVFLLGLRHFSDVGLRGSVIQNPRGDERGFLDTAWTLQILRGLLLGTICCAAAGPVSALYGEPVLGPLIMVSGLIVVLEGLFSTSLLTHQRHLALGRLEVLRLVSSTCGLAAMILVAWRHRTVWVLLVAPLVSAGVMLVLSHVVFVGTRDRLRWEKDSARELIQFGKWVFVSTLATVVAGKGDRLILGKLIPVSTLGVYSIAVKVVSLPTDMIVMITGNVLQPALAAQARRDFASMVSSLKLARRAVLPAGIFIALGVLLFSPVVVELIYDDRYLEAGWMGQLMALPVWLAVLGASVNTVLFSLGEPRPAALVNVVRAFVTCGACLGGYFAFGIAGFVLGTALGSLVGLVLLHGVLVKRKIRVWTADVGYSVALALLAVLCLLVPRLVLPDSPEIATTFRISLSVIVTGAAGTFAFFRVVAVVR